MVALVLGGGLPREVRRRPHRRRPRPRSTPTGSGSGGGAHSRRRRPSSASWAPASRPARARWPRSSGVEPLDSDRELERELGEPIESFFDREGEAALPRARGGGGARAARARRTRAWSRSAAARSAPSACARRSRAHTVVHLEVEPEEAWRRASGKGRPLARDRGRFDQLHGDRAPLYESVADAVLPPCRPRRAAAGAARARGAASPRRPGTRLVWASAASGDYPVFLGRGLIAAGFFHPPGGRRFVVTDENVARAQPFEGDERIVIHAGRGAQDARTRRARAARARRRRAPSAATSWWPSAAAWSATWPASARPSTSAACATCRCRRRWWRRSTRPTAARPAWTCPRARTTWAPTTSRRRCSCDPGRARHAAAARSSRRATPRW